MMNDRVETERVPDILIVDDIAANLKQLSEIIANCGYHPRPAQDGEMALRAVQAVPPDLVLLDVRMPGMDGYEVCRRLKEIPRLHEIPVIFISALDEAANKVEGFEAGGVDYITKPFQPEEVLARVRNHLEIRRLQLSLQRSYEEMESRVWQRTAELKTLNETLEHRVLQRTAEAEHRAAQLRALTAELAQAEHRERRRMAQLLHDHLQQLLVAARVRMLMLSRGTLDHTATEVHQAVVDLLDQCLVESRSLTIELSPPVLYDAGLGAALHWLARWMQQKHGLVVEVCVEESAEVAEEATRVFLFEAVRELLFNAVKHAHTDHAQVRVTRAAPATLQIEVQDAGVGFDSSCLESRAASDGAFGLFNIRERLRFLGGRIEIAARPGEGTRVILAVPFSSGVFPAELPASEAGAAESLEAIATSAPAAGEETPRPSGELIRLLLVDDHPILRKGLADLVRIRPEVAVVGEAGDGQEAIDLALQLKPDVVLMDITMPRMDGIEATRRITAALDHVRVIGLSMHEGEEMATAMREAGAVAYMTKGGDPDALIAAILTSVTS